MLFLGSFKEEIAPDISVVLVSSKNLDKRVCKKKFMKVYATIFNEDSRNMNNSYCFIDFHVHISK